MAVLSIPYAFTNGTIANAIEVNADFNAIKAFVESSLVHADGTVKAGTAAISDGAVTADKLAGSSVTNVKIDYSSVPRVTVSSTEPASVKAGDIWVQI